MTPSRRGLLGLLAGAIAAPALAQTPAQTLGQTTSQPLRIGVIGAGSLGGTVGRLWVGHGHEVMFATRHPEELAAMVKELGPRAFVGTPQQAAAFGAVVLFATPYDALRTLSRELAPALRGKLVLDATNQPLRSGGAEAREALARGVGETTAALLPDVRLVRAFSAVDASLLERSAGRTGGKAGVPIAGNDPAAVQAAAQLVWDAGSEPVVVGDLAAARKFQQDQPGFRANTTAPELRRLLGLADNA